MKNVLSLCMNTLKDMKTNTMYLNSQSNIVDDTDSSSDDNEDHEQNLNFSKLTKSSISKKRNLSTDRHHYLSGQTKFSNRRSIISSSPYPVSPKLTFDQGTQTDATLDPNIAKIELLEAMLKRLYQQFLSLIGEAATNETQSVFADFSETEISEMDHQSEELAFKDESAIDPPLNISNIEAVNDEKNKNAKRLCIRRASAQTTNTTLPNTDINNDMIPLGAGATKLPVTVINAIDWSSYTTATRQLLKAIFPRKVLATHSLTGKQSPAFADKPPKKALDSTIVNDIVDTVSDVCGVSKRTVRSCITTKCTDEAKLYRNRQQYKQNNESRENQENKIPPSPSSNETTASKK
ncbi:uncharacterized protein [Epargyreus clarus]